MSLEPPKSAVRETAGEDDPRALAGRVVHAIYRLIKGCFLHDDANQAITNLIEFVIESTHSFCDRAGVDAASVLFAGNSVFVNKQMLRASRETYQLALELGTLLAGCNITEVTLERSILPAHIGEFGRAVAAMHREKTPSSRLAEGGWPGLKVRKVVGFGGTEVLSPVTRVARTYAASIMIVRAFYTDLKKGKLELSHSVKRVAQKLAGIPDDEKRLLLSTAAAPSGDTDRAGLIVSSAIVAVVMAGQLTDDRSALTSLATAAVLYDAARARLTRGSGTDGPLIERVLNEEEEERLPTASIVALTALGKLHPPAVTRSVIVYEALALRNEATTPYGGARQPHVLSRILAVARAFTELRVARGTSPPLSVDDAIQVLTSQAKDNTERTFVKLLVGTLGVFPAGTLVELSSGELAVVVSTPRLPVDFARPPVRIMYDANGALLEEPIDLDLAGPAARAPGAPVRLIVKPIDASDQQMKQMRAYVMSLSAKRRKSSDKNRVSKGAVEAKPKPVERPAPRRRLSAPQAAIPEALRRLEEDGGLEQAADVEIISTDDLVESIELAADASARRAPPGLPPKRPVQSDEERARAERAKADPEVSFQAIDLQPVAPPVRSVPAAPVTPPLASGLSPLSVKPAPSSVASPASSGRVERPAVRRWDPRSEDEPPPDGLPPAAGSTGGGSPEVSTSDVVVEEVVVLAPPVVEPPPVAQPAKPIVLPPRPVAVVTAPAAASVGASKGRPLGVKTPLVAKPTTEMLIPMPAEAEPSAEDRRPSSSTREVNWSEYGKEIVEAVGVPEPSQSETDAILAAYLSEEARLPSEPPDGAGGRSAGLRWDTASAAGQVVGASSSGHSTGGSHSNTGHLTGGPSSAGHSTGGHSTGHHSTGGHSTGGHSTGGHSTGGHVTGGRGVVRPTNTGGLRWEGRSSSGRDQGSSQGADASSSQGSSSQGHESSSGGVRWDTSSQGTSAQGAERGTPVSQQGRDSSSGGGSPSQQGDPAGTPSLRGRAKAGSQAWGNPRRDKK